MKIKNTASLFSVLLLAACSAPDHEFLNKTITNATQPWSGAKWWQRFNDPLLDRFADQIFAQNLDIKIAAVRLAGAQAVTKVTASNLYPDLSGTGVGFRGKNQVYPQAETFSQAGLNVNWDLDVFGQTRAAIRASKAFANSQDASIDDVRNLVVANLAMAVIDWRQAKETIKQTNELLKSEDEQVQLLDDRAKAGLIDTSFVERARAQRAQTATQLPQAQALSKAARYQIELLLGVKDKSVAVALKKAKSLSIKLPSPDTFTSISLDSIRSRPDVRVARFNLLAQEANLEQAEANLWPNISVSSFFGVASGTGGARLGSNPLWSVGSSLTAPIFNFGRLSGLIDEANAKSKEAEYNYKNVILLALQETKTALSDYLNGLNTVTAQEEALRRRQETVAIARERFHRGLTDMTDLTTAQTELDQATLSLVVVKTSAAHAFIRLQKALGLKCKRKALYNH